MLMLPILQRAIKVEAEKMLDMTVSFRGQDQKKVDAICEKVSSATIYVLVDNPNSPGEMGTSDMFPQLAKYECCWPVRSILKLTLKYKAESSRRTATKDTNSRVRDVLRG